MSEDNFYLKNLKDKINELIKENKVLEAWLLLQSQKWFFCAQNIERVQRSLDEIEEELKETSEPKDKQC